MSRDNAAYRQEFDPKAIRKEWSKVPTDLAGWSMRANAMLLLAEKYAKTLDRIERALDA